MPSTWLHIFAYISLALAGITALAIAADEIYHPQPMGIMNIVWPVCALFGSIFVLWFYLAYGRPKRDGRQKQPLVAAVAKGTLHCGAGCTLGDVLAESLAFAVPAVAGWFGWHTLFSNKTFAMWTMDFCLAFVLGIGFQYFAIVGLERVSFGKAIGKALRADAISLLAWQIGMYAFMALVQFGIFRNAPLNADTVEFWFMMQLAMLAGFATSFPANWLLIKSGIKHRM